VVREEINNKKELPEVDLTDNTNQSVHIEAEAEDEPYTKRQLTLLPSIANMRSKKEKQHELEQEKTVLKAKRQRAVLKWQSAFSVIMELREEEKRLEAKAREMELQTSVETHAKSMFGKTSQEIRAGIFPAECRNTFTLRRFIDKEVDHVLKTCTPETVRRDKVKNILANSRFPELVKRDKSTSAIFRNYNRYKNTSAYQRNNRQGTESLSVDINERSLQIIKKKYKMLQELNTSSILSSSLM
jgi:hypothetical protein